MTRADWARSIVTVLVAVIGAIATVWVGSGGKADESDFSRAALANCRGNNELRDVLRDIIGSSPRSVDDPKASETFVDDALARLQTQDCSRLVDQ